jgi:hypothetical protein
MWIRSGNATSSVKCTRSSRRWDADGGERYAVDTINLEVELGPDGAAGLSEGRRRGRRVDEQVVGVAHDRGKGKDGPSIPVVLIVVLQYDCFIIFLQCCGNIAIYFKLLRVLARGRACEH